MKRFFNSIEIGFNITYLLTAFIVGFFLLLNTSHDPIQMLAGGMALILVSGDSFHLAPRIMGMRQNTLIQFNRTLGRGKQIASITMTLFYVILWHIGLQVYSLPHINGWSIAIYSFTIIRILICLLPQNKWEERYSPLLWVILRNAFFVFEGLMVAILYFINRNSIDSLQWMWLAITLSYLFYLPVVIWSHHYPKIGMLMLPKAMTYIWILVMFL